MADQNIHIAVNGVIGGKTLQAGDTLSLNVGDIVINDGSPGVVTHAPGVPGHYATVQRLQGSHYSPNQISSITRAMEGIQAAGQLSDAATKKLMEALMEAYDRPHVRFEWGDRCQWDATEGVAIPHVKEVTDALGIPVYPDEWPKLHEGECCADCREDLESGLLRRGCTDRCCCRGLGRWPVPIAGHPNNRVAWHLGWSPDALAS